LTACGSGETISVRKDPPAIKYSQLPALTQMSKAKVDEYGKTNWTFHCYTKFDYQIERNDRSAGNTESQVCLRITKINMLVTLPIEVITFKQAPERILDHENGHVQICQRIYENAAVVARQSCAPCLGKSYAAVGTTFDAARDSAVDQAAEDVCARYRAKTVDLANQVSDRYDFYCAQGVPIDTAIAESFKVEAAPPPPVAPPAPSPR